MVQRFPTLFFHFSEKFIHHSLLVNCCSARFCSCSPCCISFHLKYLFRKSANIMLDFPLLLHRSTQIGTNKGGGGGNAWRPSTVPLYTISVRTSRLPSRPPSRGGLRQVTSLEVTSESLSTELQTDWLTDGWTDGHVPFVPQPPPPNVFLNEVISFFFLLSFFVQSSKSQSQWNHTIQDQKHNLF